MKNLLKKKFLFLSVFFLSFLQVQAWMPYTDESSHSFRWEYESGELSIDSVYGNDEKVDTFRIGFSGEAPWIGKTISKLKILEKNRPIAIGDSVFANLKILNKIYLYNPIPPALGSGVFVDKEDIEVTVPEGLAVAYSQAPDWNAFTYPALALTGITLGNAGIEGNKTDSIAIKKDEKFEFDVTLIPSNAQTNTAKTSVDVRSQTPSGILDDVTYENGKLTGTGKKTRHSLYYNR